MSFNPYATLNITTGASKETIKTAYHILARKHHPDTGGDIEAFKQLKRAYDLLMDDTRRARFDATGDADECTPDNSHAEVISVLVSILKPIVVNNIKTAKSRDLIAEMRKGLTSKKAELEKRMADFEEKCTALADLAKRFETTDRDNFIRASLEAECRIGEEQIANVKKELDVHCRALAMLDRFRFKRDDSGSDPLEMYHLLTARADYIHFKFP